MAGQWRAPVSGHSARMDGAAARSLHRLWPRSSAADVEEALGIAAEASTAWRRRGRERRLAALAALSLPRGVRSRADAEIEALLGIAPAERPAAERRARTRFPRALLEELAADGAQPTARDPGVALVFAHACELVAGPALRALRHLAAGRSVVLLADVAFPWAGELLARAAEGAELPPGTLAVLCGDVRRLAGTCLPTLARDPRGVACVDVAGFPEDLREALRRLGDGPAGLWHPLQARSRIVPRAGDVAAAARGVLRNAFGRSGTMSGQLPGQVVRVLCHERRFSAFTEALLGQAADFADLGRPVPRLLEDGAAHARSVRALGLDEGATPVLDRSEAGFGPEGGNPRRRVGPVIFTNVEPGQRLARGTRPVPVLALLRAASDAEARGHAARLDRIDFLPTLESKGPP